jgi:hypothetical protein
MMIMAMVILLHVDVGLFTVTVHLDMAGVVVVAVTSVTAVSATAATAAPLCSWR